MIKQKLTFMFLYTFLLFSCWKNNNLENNTSPNQPQVQHETLQPERKQEMVYDTFEIIWWELETLNKNFWDITSSGNLLQLHESVKNDDFVETQKIIPIIINDYKSNKKDLKADDIEKITALEFANISAMLNEWNYFYKEDEKAKEAIEYMENIDGYENNYLALSIYWYAWEIKKDYDVALKYYNQALSLGKNDPTFLAGITRQIWHVYALKWDFSQSEEYYKKAYEINPNDEMVLLSIASLYARLKEYQKSKDYFEKLLAITSSPFRKAEVYYNLSSLTFYLDGMTYDEKVKLSFDYAKKSLESNEDFALWYFAVWRALTELWEFDDAEKNIKKWLSMYKTSSDGYKFYWILEMKKDNYKNGIKFLDMSNALIENDIGLMWYEKTSRLWENEFYKSIAYSKLKDVDNTTNSILETIQTGNMQFISRILVEFNTKDFWIYSELKSDTKFQTFVTWLNKILIK